MSDKRTAFEQVLLYKRVAEKSLAGKIAMELPSVKELDEYLKRRSQKSAKAPR